MADGPIGGVMTDDVLYVMDNDSGGITVDVADPVFGAGPNGTKPVVGAKNLRSVIANGSGIFRLYFSAPVNSTQNSGFIPLNSTITDFGTKPWVHAVAGE